MENESLFTKYKKLRRATQKLLKENSSLRDSLYRKNEELCRGVKEGAVIGAFFGFVAGAIVASIYFCIF